MAICYLLATKKVFLCKSINNRQSDALDFMPVYALSSNHRGKIMTIGQALKETADRLKLAGIPDADVEAQHFLTHLLTCRRHELFLNNRKDLAASETSAIEEFIKRRLRREPIQYIIGSVEFHGLEFKVNQDVLIPRPETELLVDEAVKAACSREQEVRVIDLCTGSGCVAVALAVIVPKISVYAVDISQAALDIAQENANRLGAAGRILFAEGDLFTPLVNLIQRNTVDIIVSNPPYVSAEDYNKLQPEIRLFEPRSALVSGAQGLEFYNRIIKDGPEYLSRKGLLMMEAGYGQAERIVEIIKADGRYEALETIKDLAGIERVIKARIRD